MTLHSDKTHDELTVKAIALQNIERICLKLN